MKASIIKVAALTIVVAALSAPVASAKPYVDTPGQDQGMQVTPPASSSLNTPAQDQGMQSSWPASTRYLDFPGLARAIHTTIAAPNDRAGTQGIGQTPDTIGMGGAYGANLIKDAQAAKKRDLQSAKTFTLPLAPDDRPGTAAVTPALVIPYLSHGIGVNAAQFSGSPVRPDDRAGSRPSVPTSFAAPIATPSDGFNWGTAGIGAAGFAALALAISLLVVLGRRSRHEGVAVS